MREDQYHRLQALEEKITDQFLFEADPANWTGEGVLPKDLTQQDRGDRYWCKKNAVATISLAIRIGSLIGRIQMAGTTTPAAEGDGEDGDSAGLLDAEVKAAEREAQAMLSRFQRQQGKKAPAA